MLTIPCHHPDYQKLRVLVTVLGGYFGSRLMSNIREEKGYTYGISAGLVSCPGSSVLFISQPTSMWSLSSMKSSMKWIVSATSLWPMKNSPW